MVAVGRLVQRCPCANACANRTTSWPVYASQEACERCRAALVAALQRDGLPLAEAEAGGFFRLAQYGPLHSLQTRVNEIWLAVKL